MSCTADNKQISGFATLCPNLLRSAKFRHPQTLGKTYYIKIKMEVIEMSEIKYCYCPSCEKQTAHEVACGDFCRCYGVFFFRHGQFTSNQQHF